MLVACLTAPAAPSFDEAAIAKACNDQASNVCALRESCSTLDDYNNVLTFGDDATCLAREQLVCVNNLHIVTTGQTPAHVETCAQSYPGFSCSSFFSGGLPDRCVGIGPGITGDPCSGNAQCNSDFCAVAPHQVCGTCQPQPAIGSTCVTRAQCGHDLTCGVPVGETTGHCVLPAGDGMPCLTGMQPCVVGETCVGSDVSHSTSGVCMPAASTIGAPCDNTAATKPSCDLTLGLQCTGTTGTCEPVVFVGPGAACGIVGANDAKTDFVCAAGASCIKATATCVAAAADGAACDTASGPPCLNPAVCLTDGDATAGVCTIPDPAMCF